MKDQFNKIIKELENLSFPNWNELPNIDLYMDQVSTYLDRELNPLKITEDDKILTPSMINNYVKGDLIPSPEHKKYNKEHLSRLFIISSLKQILSISDIKEVLNSQTDINVDLYELFNNEHKKALESETSKIKSFLDNVSDDELQTKLNLYIIRLAMYAEVQKVLAEKLLNVIIQKKQAELEELEKAQKEEKIISKQSKKNKPEGTN